MTMMPTATTIAVAATGTAMFRSTHSGNHGNKSLVPNTSRTGAIEPRDNSRTRSNYLSDSFLCRATRI